MENEYVAMAELRSFRFMLFIGLLGIGQSESLQSASDVADVQGFIVNRKIPRHNLKPLKNAYDSSDRPRFNDGFYDLQHDQTDYRKEDNGSNGNLWLYTTI